MLRQWEMLLFGLRYVALYLSFGQLRNVMTHADYYRELAEDCLFAARQTSVREVKDACLKDAAYFRALAVEIERRDVTE
jgi:hypothetical protein